MTWSMVWVSAWNRNTDTDRCEGLRLQCEMSNDRCKGDEALEPVKLLRERRQLLLDSANERVLQALMITRGTERAENEVISWSIKISVCCWDIDVEGRGV